MLRVVLISISIINIRLIKYIENMDKVEDKALVYIEEIIEGIYIIEKDTREVKEIKDSNRRSAMFIIN